MATAIGTAMAMATIEETTVPKARTAMPKTGGRVPVFHSKVVRKLPSSSLMARTAR
ncbi:hypothetical protein GCM10020295_45110 [Streptomyces cinereospinus]